MSKSESIPAETAGHVPPPPTGSEDFIAGVKAAAKAICASCRDNDPRYVACTHPSRSGEYVVMHYYPGGFECQCRAEPALLLIQPNTKLSDLSEPKKGNDNE